MQNNLLLNTKNSEIQLIYSTDEYKKKLFNQIIESEKDNNGSSIFTSHPIKFYFKKNDKWIAVDNSTYCCWVEEFKSLNEAINWLVNENYVSS